MIKTLFEHKSDLDQPATTPLRSLADDIRELGRTAEEKGFVPVHGKYLGPVATTTLAPRPDETAWPTEAQVVIYAIDHPTPSEAERVSATLVDRASKEVTPNVINGSLGNMVLYNESGDIVAGVTPYNRSLNITGTFDELLGGKPDPTVSAEGVDHLIDQAAGATDFAVLQPSGDLKTYPIEQLYPPTPETAA